MIVTTIGKPWGGEKIIESSPYLFKELFMFKGRKCSLQHHNDKTETVYVVKGKLKVQIEDSTHILYVGDFVTIYPGQIHRMEAIEDTTYVEASTPHPNDVIRHEDDYGRL